MSGTTPRHDRHHHHPEVHKVSGRWAWFCGCGSASCRTRLDPVPWHQVVVEALGHATTIAA
ncbi:hypothetical protein RKE38_08365 [Phycicoccus sp. M110.8]|uniref:hypothetical protein n=1 Tax=Phycicoccus sp. M110.8 TaxID=3075433 RepID=UPI0028FD31CE|nr:hypothetical protein [Phycicoccus sp. M110.8]MDU0313701.1 hypothetical protein [Phycicoccus sp. M110.8]